MKRVLTMFVVSLVPVFSCGGTSAVPGDVVETRAAPTIATIAPPLAEDAPIEQVVVPEAELTLPAGTFRDLHALCAQQMKDVVPQLEKARLERAERYEGEEAVNVIPACDVDAAAMRGVRVSLAAPYLDAKAVTYETGRATQTSLIVRTSDGWTNVGTPMVTSDHDDPGCPSILRDAGLVEVRVDGGHLVVVDKADRGAGDENSMVYERARTCSFSGCTEPVTIGARLVPWEKGVGTEKRLFSTTYTVDEIGTIVPARTWDGAPE